MEFEDKTEIKKMEEVINNNSVFYPFTEKPENNTEYVKLSISSYNNLTNTIDELTEKLATNDQKLLELSKKKFSSILIRSNGYFSMENIRFSTDDEATNEIVKTYESEIIAYKKKIKQLERVNEPWYKLIF